MQVHLAAAVGAKRGAQVVYSPSRHKAQQLADRSYRYVCLASLTCGRVFGTITGFYGALGFCIFAYPYGSDCTAAGGYR